MNPVVWLVSRKLTEQAGSWDERLVRDNDGEYICRVVVGQARLLSRRPSPLGIVPIMLADEK